MFSLIDNNDLDYSGNIKPEVLAEIQSEREAIRVEAQENGTFMKAPNGNDTNLNEAQWIDVRTKRFKDWFGDWQNDPENSSKVVDENGEPLVVYHGGAKDIEQFNTDSIFFAKDEDVARSYSGNEGQLYPSFVNLRRPLIEKGAHNNWDDVRPEIPYYEKYRIIDNDGNLVEDGIIYEKDAETIALDRAYEDKLDSDPNLDIDDVVPYNFEKYYDNENVSTDDLFDVATNELNYDGVILDGITDSANLDAFFATTVVIASKPNQIKSATENVGTYSANNNDIRYSLESTANINVVENDYIESELFKDISSIPFITKEQSLGVYKSIYTEGLDYWKDSDVKC